MKRSTNELIGAAADRGERARLRAKDLTPRSEAEFKDFADHLRGIPSEDVLDDALQIIRDLLRDLDALHDDAMLTRMRRLRAGQSSITTEVDREPALDRSDEGSHR
jgi:hypothetical protein